jgi:hypothetical protein
LLGDDLTVKDFRAIRFEVRLFGTHAHELVPVVDSSSLVELVTTFEADSGYEPAGGYAGLVLEHYRFGDLTRYLAGEQSPWPGARVPLLGCQCGEWGCWPLIASVTVKDQEVLWSDFRQPHRAGRDYSRFGPFTFREPDYRHAVLSATARTADDLPKDN